jgi:peptidoglycan-N-acetylglucosamine deacetylase
MFTDERAPFFVLVCVKLEKMKALKPIASLSLDLDNKWSYMKIHGDRGWESLPSYLDILVPRVLDFLKAHNLTVTFFIVGQDAALRKNHAILRSIADAGHEIGNHSFHHEPWMHLYSRQEIETEINLAEEHIENATGQKPLGFRGPGYSLSQEMLRQVVGRGYRYDASTFPNLLTPLARAYYFATAEFTLDQKRQWQASGGTLRDSLRSVKPYLWRLDNGTLIEIPVTTLPVLKIPIHISYLLCLRLLGRELALQYFKAALRLCQLTHTLPSIVLHPTDFLGGDDTKDLAFIPGMGFPREKKMEFVSDVLKKLSAEFSVVTVHQHACFAADVCDLRMVEPSLERVS